MKHWRYHPYVATDKERSFGEKAADRLRLGMGSWTFFIVFGTLLILWIVTAGFGFDPNPYFRLNLMLSMIAGMQGSALLISDKRSDRINADITRYHLELTEEIHQLLGEAHKEIVLQKEEDKDSDA
jgi:uncharacterized membrane protein